MCWGANLHNFPAVHHRHTSRERYGFFLVVRDYDKGNPQFVLKVHQFKLGLFT